MGGFNSAPGMGGNSGQSTQQKVESSGSPERKTSQVKITDLKPGDMFIHPKTGEEVTFAEIIGEDNDGGKGHVFGYLTSRTPEGMTSSDVISDETLITKIEK